MRATRALPSIRGRLSGVLVAVALVWGLAVSAIVWLSVSHEVDELLDDTLEASAEVLVQLLAGVEAALPPPQAAQVVAPRGDDERFAWQLVGAGGTVVQRSALAPAAPWLPLATVGFADAADGWRVYGMRLGNERVLYVGQTREERREAQVEVTFSSVFAALAIALSSTWWLRRRVRQELQPLTALADALGHYEPLAPAARLQPPARDELAPIHEAIEGLAQRLARRIAHERAFSAHAAHALRTPLAGIDAQLAVALRECAPAQRERLERVRQASARLTRVVTALLALFRSGIELHRRTVDLAALLERWPIEGLDVRVHVGGGGALHADPDLLTAALLNLCDNALAHGARRVDVALDADPAGHVVTLHDDGRGVAEARRAELQAALDSQSYEGRMGLGLTLADLVARAHGGALELPRSERGFAVRLRLGAAPQA